MTPNADTWRTLDLAKILCNDRAEQDEAHWAPLIPYPCTPCLETARRVVKYLDQDRNAS